MSDKKRTAVYAAVHEEIMRLRIGLCRNPKHGASLDVEIARAGERAAMAAIEAAFTRKAK